VGTRTDKETPSAGKRVGIHEGMGRRKCERLKAGRVGQRAFLFLDSAPTHACEEALDVLEKGGVEVITLPPHTTSGKCDRKRMKLVQRKKMSLWATPMLRSWRGMGRIQSVYK
jgi:hypothetical protein